MRHGKCLLTAAIGLGGVPLLAAAQSPMLRRDTATAIVVGPQQTGQAWLSYNSSGATTNAPSFWRSDTPVALGASGTAELRVFPGLAIGGLRTPGGTYSLWIVAAAGEPMLIVNRRGGDAPYDPAQDLGRVKLKVDTTAGSTGNLMILFHRVRLTPDTLGVVVRDAKPRDPLPVNRTALQVGSGLRTTLIIAFGHENLTALVTAPDSLLHHL